MATVLPQLAPGQVVSTVLSEWRRCCRNSHRGKLCQRSCHSGDGVPATLRGTSWGYRGLRLVLRRERAGTRHTRTRRFCRRPRPWLSGSLELLRPLGLHRPVLHLAGAVIGVDRDSAGGRLAVHKLHACRNGAVSEQTLAAAENDREGPEPVLVDEIVLD